jgi:hypothetical protein
MEQENRRLARVGLEIPAVQGDAGRRGDRDLDEGEPGKGGVADERAAGDPGQEDDPVEAQDEDE